MGNLFFKPQENSVNQEKVNEVIESIKLYCQRMDTPVDTNRMNYHVMAALHKIANPNLNAKEKEQVIEGLKSYNPALYDNVKKEYGKGIDAHGNTPETQRNIVECAEAFRGRRFS